MVAMNLDANTYVIAIDGTSRAATLLPYDANQSSLVLFNASTTSVAVSSNGGASAATLTFPASATAPVACTVLGPGVTATFTKNINDQFISAIQAVAGTGNLYIKVGSGE